MKSLNKSRFLLGCLTSAAFLGHGMAAQAAPATPPSSTSPTYLSPSALAFSPENSSLYIACSGANQVWVHDTASDQTSHPIPVPSPPSGLAYSPRHNLLVVTCAGPPGWVGLVHPGEGQITRQLNVGHTAIAPVLSPDAATLYVCLRFDNEVAFIDMDTFQVTRRVPVAREPISAALTPDGTHLLVAQHLHSGRADVEVVAAEVTVIDTRQGQVTQKIPLPNGSGLLRDIRVSPDGRQACVAHQLSRYHLPTTQIERGWINNNAFTLIDLTTLKPINTILLDSIDRGAANPWAVTWSGDGQQLLITHTGMHEVSVIDYPALLAKLAALPSERREGSAQDYTTASRTAADVPNDLSFLVGLRQRIPLPGRGPRSMIAHGTNVWISQYFSDSLDLLALSPRPRLDRSLPLQPAPEMSLQRQGEFYFNDATICFQGWQSCASCHSSDARVDGLNWDNLNDGIGNPKNAKSMVWAHRTPPSMALGVRPNAEAGVRAGIRHALFSVQPESVAQAMDAYLGSLEPMPSPYLDQGQLSAAARRGQILFHRSDVGCSDCHPAPLYTDLKSHRVGTHGKYDQPGDKFDTPALVELWRSSPYLHDGSAVSIQEVLTTRNAEGKHGDVKSLSAQELQDLVAFVLSL